MNGAVRTTMVRTRNPVGIRRSSKTCTSRRPVTHKRRKVAMIPSTTRARRYSGEM